MRGLRGSDIAMIFQEPMTALNPLYTVGDQIMETIQSSTTACRPRDARKRAVALLARTGIHRAGRAASNSYPHRAFRRATPARDDRDGARVPPAPLARATSPPPRST